jgi:uncharacterized DUF497 family protein
MATHRFTWDERKRAANLHKHGVDFAIVERFEFDTALIVVDDRKDYGEVRLSRVRLDRRSSPRSDIHDTSRTDPSYFATSGQR